MARGIGEEDESAILADSASRQGKSRLKTSKLSLKGYCATNLTRRTERFVSLDGSRKPSKTSSRNNTLEDSTDADHRLREFMQGLRSTVIDGEEHWYDPEKQRPYTLQEIADIMGVSRERVRQIEEAGLRKMWRRLRAMNKRENLDESDWLQIANDHHGEDRTIYMPS